MKLEAVDRLSASFSVGVATIADLLGEWLLVHFDGRPDAEFWTENDSPHLHPINWHKKQKFVQFTPPKDQVGLFDWEMYLRQTKSSAAISNQFKCRSPNAFKVRMKVEAVDPLNPRYVRVATVVARKAFAVKLHFDNWDEKFDFWISDNSPDLHPVQWCLQANINLEPPPTGKWCLNAFGKCSTPNCNGVGHLRNPDALEHCTTSDCPYAVENANYVPSDRLAAGSTCSETDSISKSHSTADDCRSSASSGGADHSQSVPVDLSEKDLVKELNSFVNTLSPEEVLEWSAEKVSDLVSILPRCNMLAHLFLDERLDGQSFLLLTHNDLVNILGLSGYQAFMIYNTICQIRRNLTE